MKALIWSENKLRKTEVAEPEIKTPNQVKIKIHLTGICGTDLALIAGKEQEAPEVIRGHEAVGTVTGVGEKVGDIKVGDRVVIDPNQYCGNCYYCRRGATNLCNGGRTGGFDIAGLNIHGTFAEYFVCEDKYVYRIPDNMSWETALMIEPLACVLHNLMKAEISVDDSVLVLGSGPMGMLCQMASKKLSRLTAATEKSEFRLKYAKTISDYAFSPEMLSVETVYKINSGRKFDLVIDAIGNQLEFAEEYIERGGRIVLLGINPNYKFTFSPAKYLSNGIKILGLGEYNQLFETTIQFASTLPDLNKLVTRKYPLEEYKEAINELLGYDLDTRCAVSCETIKTALML
ncbi:MAG: alcohol dehydrogenase catalytic domain-containing protein [Clostridia bacterium]|nr:alcohol dehydrogenase catalytic domain-containing protein [Clostridia bacterium]